MFSPKKMASLAFMVFLLLLIIELSGACKKVADKVKEDMEKVAKEAKEAKEAKKVAEISIRDPECFVVLPSGLRKNPECFKRWRKTIGRIFKREAEDMEDSTLATDMPEAEPSPEAELVRKRREAEDSPEAEPLPEAELSPEAEDSPLVTDLTDPAMNVEPLDPDNMKILEQVVPGKFAIALVNIVPCGVVIAHAHCYADALVYIIKSSPGLEGGYIVENDDLTTVVPIKNLKAGMTVTISRGRVHWVTNQDCNEEVQLLQFFNSDNIDRVRPDTAVASVPAHVLEDSFGIDVARQLSERPQPDPENLMVRSASCMARCAKDGRRKMWDHDHN